MAEIAWVGGTSGDWGLAANWSPAQVPVSNDDVIIDSGSRSIDEGLDQSAVDLDTMYVGNNYTGGIGNSETAPLQIGCDKMVFAEHGGGSNHYIESKTAAIDELRVFGVGASGTGNLYLLGTTAVGIMFLRQGTVQLYSGTITEVHIASDADSANIKLEVLDATLTTLWQHVGTSEILSTSSSGVIANANILGGTCNVNAGTITNLVGGGATINWDTTTDITSAKMLAGLLDGSDTADARTVVTLYISPGATFDRNNGLDNISVTNLNDWGGTIRPGLG